MPFMTWKDNLSVGVKQLDEDHKNLVGMINELHEAMRAGKGAATLDKILGGLVEYTKTHFAREEEFFKKTGYPQAASHRQEHEALTQRVTEVQNKHKAGTNGSLSIEVLDFLKDWLVKHIQGSDQSYGPFLNSKGIH